MRRFWEDAVRPCFEAAGVRRIVEIGSDHGENTVKLVNYAVEKGGFVYSIDPAPQFDYAETFRGREAYYQFLQTTSVNALAGITDYDAILIDGDHNYYTVYTELQLVLRNAVKFPLVFFHDVSWPYDRRDLYYNPDTIPAAWQNAYKVSGIDPDTDELSDKGFNHKLHNSLSYTNYRCGVLTAVEDFLKENQPRFSFVMVPLMCGLGILVDGEQSYPRELYDRIRELTPSGPLARLMRFSDKWFGKTHSRLEQYAENYQKAKEKLQKKDEDYAALKDRYQDLSGRCDSLQTSADKAGKELAALRTERDGLKTEKEALRTERDGLRTEKEALQSERDGLKAEKETLKKDREAIRQQLLTAQNEKQALSEECSALRSDTEKLQQSCAELQKQRSVLQKLGDDLQKARDDFRKQLEDCRQKLLRKNGEYEALREKNIELSGSLSEEARKTELSRSELAAVRKNLDSLKEREKQLLGELQKVSKERDDFKDQLFSCERRLERQREIAEENAAAADIHLNSVSYQIGQAIIAATHSLKAFFRLPRELLRLWRQGKAQTKMRSEAAGQIGRPAGKPKPAQKRAEAPKAAPAQKPAAPAAQPKAAPAAAKAAPKPAPKPRPGPARYTEADLRKFHRERVRRYTGEDRPLVSIIVLNRDGLHHLQRLFASLKTAVFYDNYELIVFDNGSTDGSVDFVKSQDLGKNTVVIECGENKSFSAANNEAARAAKGSYLLFLNNDIEVTDCWLDEMLKVSLGYENVGAVGAKLVYPKGIRGINEGKDDLIQHRGIVFQRDSFQGRPFIRPVNLGNGEQAWPDDGEAREIAAVTAAALLISREAFERVGGFDEQYVYGYEDVDLCLKLQKSGCHNYCTPRAMMFHHEFGSQKNDDNQAIVARRTNNIHHFQDKWQDYLSQQLEEDLAAGTRLFADRALCFAFAVTEAGENVTAGDYFTALELATALEKHGHTVKYLCRRGGKDWYDVGTEVDVLISMLDAYDLSRMYHTKKELLTIAWARNWFSRWAENPSIQQYSFVFASSRTACDYMEKNTGRKTVLFPIATNAERFMRAVEEAEKPEDREKYECDYVFTGSYWNDPREIMDILDPKSTPYRFRVFGKNWEQVPKFAEYTGGFLDYREMPLVYKYTKIVVDDANRVTIEYGAVNSRVYDALAAGRLVMTNGVKGAEETFLGMLPTFRSAREFKEKLTYYMEHPQERTELTGKLQQFVLENHTYDIRANTLLELVKGGKPAAPGADRKIAILAPVPKWSEVNSWGDYHFAVAMKKCFEEKGYQAEIRILPEWEKEFDGKYVIVLRGLSVYHPKEKHVNIMWNISHPDDVPLEEYNRYDAVFVSSLAWAEHLKPLLRTQVFPLLQCTDPQVFNGEAYGDGGEKRYELLFVGNSRKVFRKILKDLLPTPYDLSVFGTNWKGLIDDRYIKGESIPNDQLGREYHDAAILLNDHWDDMKEKGFISNRIFDGLSAGAFLISDEIAGIDEVLKDCIVTYRDREDLAEKVKYYMEHPEEREAIARRGMAIVREKHTFRARVDEMIGWMQEN